ncbi:MAG TPA: XrtA system polysaccharide deacetylase [Vicinamibacterales bacterium]|nr:XrtA system polysaccharide deacetylase [Vicinamibacterales bacterium]
MESLKRPVVNALTFDVEDYFQVSAFDRVLPRSRWKGCEARVEHNMDALLALLDEVRVKATFFVLGWVAEQHPALVRRIAAGGHEIASHGFGHRLVYELTPEAFREDLRRARWAIEAAGGGPVVGYRAPSYSITKRSLWALDVLVEEGFLYDASVFPIRHDRYGIPDAPRHPYVIDRPAGRIWEVPPSTVRWLGANLPVAGGGYFRLLPYQWTRWGIAYLNQHEERPAVFYLHPWEFDPEQPRLPAGLVARFRHYHNLDKTAGRLRRLLGDFRWAPLSASLGHVLAAPPRPLAVAAVVAASA